MLVDPFLDAADDKIEFLGQSFQEGLAGAEGGDGKHGADRHEQDQPEADRKKR
ncbi:MAG: hypothetical protein HC826_01975 [Rhodospirillales bacterium]|nr:hypothetical protein [Rhodospirillales bacterium]